MLYLRASRQNRQPWKFGVIQGQSQRDPDPRAQCCVVWKLLLCVDESCTLRQTRTITITALKRITTNNSPMYTHQVKFCQKPHPKVQRPCSLSYNLEMACHPHRSTKEDNYWTLSQYWPIEEQSQTKMNKWYGYKSASPEVETLSPNS